MSHEKKMNLELFAALTFFRETRQRSRNMLIKLTTETMVDAIRKENILNYIKDAKERYESDKYEGIRTENFIKEMIFECIIEIDNTKFTEMVDFFFEFEAHNENEEEDAMEKYNLYICRMRYILRLIYIIDIEICKLYLIDQ